MIFPFVSLAKLPPIHTKTFAINSFYEGAPDWPYPCGVIQIAGQMPFWDEARRPLRPIARLIGEHSFMCFYMTEAPPSRDAGLIFDGDRVVGQTEPPHNLETFNHMRKLTFDVFRRAGYRAFPSSLAQPPLAWCASSGRSRRRRSSRTWSSGSTPPARPRRHRGVLEPKDGR